MKSNELELPLEIKELYRHWDYDIAQANIEDLKVLPGIINPGCLEEIGMFARERMRAWVNRQEEAYPTSDDEVIAKFKFCNIYRELDKQTIYFHSKLNPCRDDFSLWLLNMFACRFLANTDTVDKVGFLSVGEANKHYLDRLKGLASPKFGNAYVFPISTIQASPWPAREEFLSLYVPVVIEQVTQIISSKKSRTVNELLEDILPVFGFNHRFLWTEVLIDVHYQYPELVNLNRDFHIGPGAKQSLEHLRSNQDSNLSSVLDSLGEEYKYLDGVNLQIGKQKIPLSAENWEGICCEFRKYKNLQSGKGRRRLYKLII